MPKSSEKFLCPDCGGASWRTIDARLAGDAVSYDRQRLCLSCRAVYLSQERLTIKLKGIQRPSTTRIEFLG